MLPPMIFRLGFLVLVVAPVILSKKSLFPCILSSFVIISVNRHVPSYMPFMPAYLAITTLVALVGKNYKSGTKAPMLLIVLMLYSILIDFVRSMSIESISVTSLIVVLFFLFIDTDLERRSREISLSFIVISLFLCVEMFMFKSEFTYTKAVGNIEYQSVGWNDPNYFTSIIGIGAMAALNLLLSCERISKFNRISLIGVIMIVILVSLKVASRGGVAALVGGAATLLILSRLRSRTAIWISLFFVVFIIALYEYGAFDFLISRFSNDEGELGGRKLIWTSKMADFSAQASLLDWLVGIGHKGALAMSTYINNKSVLGFHNDFIAILISYGIIGLFIVLSLYFYPIFKYKDPQVTAICIYLIIISMTLEPLSSGALDIFYLYFYACILGESKRKCRNVELRRYITN